MGRRIDRVSGGGGDRSRRLERPRASAASRGNLTGGSGRRAGGDPERRGREGGFPRRVRFFGEATRRGRDASRRRTFGGGGADGASGRSRRHHDAPADRSASDAARGRRARGATPRTLRASRSARDARRGDGVRRTANMWGPLRGCASCASESGSPSAGSSGYRREAATLGQSAAGISASVARPLRVWVCDSRRIGPSIASPRTVHRKIRIFTENPTGAHVPPIEFPHRISIEPSTHTRTYVGTSRANRTPPARIPLRPFPTPTPIPSPGKPTRPKRTPPRASPPRGARLPDERVVEVRRDTRAKLRRRVRRRRPQRRRTSPGRSSAGVAAATSRVRTASTRRGGGGARRVTSAEGGRFRRPGAADASAPSRASSPRRRRAASPRDVSRGCPHRRESRWWRGVCRREERGEASRDAQSQPPPRAVRARARLRARGPGSSRLGPGFEPSPPRAHTPPRGWRRGARGARRGRTTTLSNRAGTGARALRRARVARAETSADAKSPESTPPSRRR